MKVTRHAVDHYIERVLRISLNQAGDSIRELAEEQVRLAAFSPEIIYQEEGNDVPIHIRNGCAVPVVENGSTFVPTTYDAGNFIRKLKRRVN